MSVVLDRAVSESGEFRADFVVKHCRSEEDCIVLAVALMQQAEIILTQLDGKRGAAAHFYAAADRIAAPE